MMRELASAASMNYDQRGVPFDNPYEYPGPQNDTYGNGYPREYHPGNYDLQTAHKGFAGQQNVPAPSQARGANQVVKRDLRSYHIFFIAISGTIGMGLFDSSGEVLAIAGPGGGLLAYGLVGIGVIAVMEGIAEMIAHWPISNAMIEFVKCFVDRDLAVVIGVAYWYAYSISFATLIIAGANLATYWSWSITGQDIVFIAAIPLTLLGVNCIGVFWYGWTETVSGALKLLLVLGAFIIMCFINARDTGQGNIGSQYIDDGFQNNMAVASNHAIAVLVCIPIVAYGYIGVEIVAVTALEAHNPMKSLKYPAKYIAYIIAGIYFFSVVFFYLNVSWRDLLLPSLEARIDQGPSVVQPSSNDTSKYAVVVIAIKRADISVLPDILNGFLIMAVLSAANTALYVSSRTLFGLTRSLNPGSDYVLERWLSRLGTTTPGTKIPGWASVISALSFCWVPFLHLKKGVSDQDLQEIMSGIATVAVVLVWASQCLAFIRYRYWLGRWKSRLTGTYEQFNHESSTNNTMPFSSLVGWMQPVPAWFGLVSCILTVLVFSTAGWWNGGERKIDICAAFVGPAALLVIWVLLKIFRFHKNGWYVKLGTWDDLRNTLDSLTACIRPETDAADIPLEEVPERNPYEPPDESTFI